ncbi:MAG: hypothetical protein H7A45_04370 [Verrucomicrobiales bacterium]|nr:hypothetical protein [Verrucomicrobiales bacterium]MCP5528424.1 hypothetical protein [Verrucomicrobiales bacterium]
MNVPPRKGAGDSLDSSAPPGAGETICNKEANATKRLLRLAIVLIGCLCAGAQAAERETFNYTITATGTSNVITHPVVRFTYTVTGTGTEMWTELVSTNRNLNFKVENTESGTTADTFPFVVLFTGNASLRYNLVGKPSNLVTRGVRSRMSLEQDGVVLCSADTGTEGQSRSGTCRFDAVAGLTYLVHLFTSGELGEGRASVTVSLPDQVEATFVAQRSAQDQREGSVGAMDGEKEIGPVGVGAFPRPERGGEVSDVTYAIDDDNPEVSTWIRDEAVFARTSYSETMRAPWSATQSGSGSVESGMDATLVSQSTLVAPNADTEWSVVDDNPRVATWMQGRDLFARTIAVDPPSFHSADFRSPQWVIDATETGRVLSYWRAGAYHANAAGLDGFAAGAGPAGAKPHSADFREPFWRIDDTEMNRVLSYWRAGGYQTDPRGADGYAPAERIGLLVSGPFVTSPTAEPRTPDVRLPASRPPTRGGNQIK